MQISAVASRRRARRGGDPQLRQRQRGDRRSRAARRRAACASSRPRESTSATTDVLVCSTGLIGIPMPMAALEAGIPKLCGVLSAEGGGDAAQAMLTTDTVRKEAVAPRRARRSSAAWPRARRCSRPRWPRCSRCSPPTRRPSPTMLQQALAQAVGETFDCLSVDGCRSTNDTVIVLANGRAGAVDPIAAHRRAHRGVRLARRADGARRGRRDQVRARARRRRAHAGRSARRGRARWPTVSSCSARSTAATPTGAACSPSSVRAVRSSIPSRSTSRTTASPCAATASRARTTRPRSPRRWPGARSSCAATCALAHGEADRAHHRPLARVHRREPAHVVSPARRRSGGSDGRTQLHGRSRAGGRSRMSADPGSAPRARRRSCSPRRCRTSASSRARPS